MSSVAGLVFNIQRFSVHDGPGIRTTVFMKGCGLNCRWCSNPESQKRETEIMISNAKCDLCGDCALVCPRNIIKINSKLQINRTACDLCLTCINSCPRAALAIVGRRQNTDEVVAEVVKDELLYVNSNGGVTISGGEPLLQWKFVLDLLARCKQKGFHTALDTSGYGDSTALCNLLEYTDLVLYDIKHTDPRKHVEGTGKSNSRIITNLRLAANKRRTWIRVPVIPGYNDDRGNLETLALLARETGVEKVSLLPYHMFGVNKYAQLGRRYGLKIKPPEQASMLSLKRIIEDFDIKVTVGY
ncbi:MAG: hypothetical protein A2Z02_02205 [Chloroflexi bacterium RBG_16_48_7]|nr:MAG: hypothetical protein A2Z02_02205 [Chloroflexi bacterium RBG_16_48_7]